MSSSINRLLDIMARLRDRQRGCPWDLEQTFDTIAPYTIEEAYEVADAIEREDLASLRDELGDLLFQVVFHSQMAREQGSFGFDDVVAAICDKMERRHPHVFGDARIDTAAAQTVAWEEQKRLERERSGKSILADVPLALPALTRANKLGKRASNGPMSPVRSTSWTRSSPSCARNLASRQARRRSPMSSAMSCSASSMSAATWAWIRRARYAAPTRNSSAGSAT
jgi:uncharacterized protein YabN with tetrapyrrole methylase and pyrophosphatase domain